MLKNKREILSVLSVFGTILTTIRGGNHSNIGNTCSKIGNTIIEDDNMSL